jgi:hypothetical protein
MVMKTKATKESALYYHHSNIHEVMKEAKQGVCHLVALSFTLKNILTQKENQESSSISPCKNIISKKILYKRPKSFKILKLYN